MEVYMNIQKIALILAGALCLIGGSIQAKHRHHHRHHHTNFGVSFNVGRPVVMVPRYPVYCYKPVLVRPRPVVCYHEPRVSFKVGFGSFGLLF